MELTKTLKFSMVNGGGYEYVDRHGMDIVNQDYKSHLAA
jgi:hypothetical protein